MLSRSNKAESQYPGEKRSKEISLTTVGVIIVHGVETCQQQRYPRRDKRKLSSSKERRALTYTSSWTNHLRRPTIPDSCVIPCQAGMIARSPSSCNDQTINVSRCRTISIYPFWRNQSLGTSLPNWKLKSRGDRSFVRPFRKTHFDKYKYNL